MCKYSVAIPTYNRVNFLKKSIDSVLKQTFSNYELLIIDDGSTDTTKKVIKNYKDTRIKYFYQNKNGVSAARNRAIKESQGDYIAFLDSDDWWLKTKLKETELAIENHPEYYIYHTEEKWFRNGSILNQKKRHKKPTGDIFRQCLNLCCVSMSTAVVKKEVFNDIGLFDEKFPVCEDYDFWLRVSVNYQFYLIDKSLTEKDGGHLCQLSKKYKALDKFRVKAIVNLLNSGKLNKEKYNLAFNELKKKCLIYIAGCKKRKKEKESKEYIQLIEKYNRQRTLYNLPQTGLKVK